MRVFRLAAPAAALAGLAGYACTSSDPAKVTPTTDAGVDSGEAVVMRSSGLAQTCERQAKVTAVPETCNGDKRLCARTYDKVAVPVTHNSFAVVSEGYAIPNQNQGLARQLDDGIRGMMLDTYYYDGVDNRALTSSVSDLSLVDQVYLCHGLCAPKGSARLLDGLCTITRFLDAHPGETFSIIFQNAIADGDTDALLTASGLSEYLYTHPSPTAPWPTLSEMIQSGKRLVVFLEKGGGAPAHLHPAWTNNIWDTPYTFKSPAEFTCKLNRGAQTNPLFLVNHWLDPPSVDGGATVNVNAVLGARVTKCTSEAGRVPTFVGVDYYDLGDLFAVVRKANGL